MRRSVDQTVRQKQSLFIGLGAVLLVSLTGCVPAAKPVQKPAARLASEIDYQPPPQVTSVRNIAGDIEVFGTAAAKATVRLARPTGLAGQAVADKGGHWVIRLPSSGQTEIYGVSETTPERVLQASGYLLVTQGGMGVVLRSGAGALALAPSMPARVSAFDVDREGGAVVSGFGPAGMKFSVWVDGNKLGEGRADPQGRFALPLTGPVNVGHHSLKVFGEAIDAILNVDATPAASLASSPYRAVQYGPDLKVDWMTPGGGEQTTWIYGLGGGAK